MDQEENGVPENLKTVIETFGFLVPGDASPEEQAIFSLPREGKCMCCRGDLSASTSLVLTTSGIVMAFCCGQCHTDMAVVGWIQEQHDDLVSSIKFRGIQWDENN